MPRQEETVDLICPQCGYKLGEQLLSRFYEQKVAEWLGGEVCASLNPYFDVWKCAEFPDLTFQVKYANTYHFSGEARRHRHATWPFSQNQMGENQPDYFILFGITDERNEHCFLLRRQAFIDCSSKMGETGRIMLMAPYQFSRRGRPPKSYVHENKVWKYEVKNPEQNLTGRIRTYETFKQERLF